MGSSMTSLLVLWTLLLASSNLVNAATVNYDFTVGWVRANPDGAFERPVIGINGQWPVPHITATVGDQVVVNVKNELGNQTTSLHFHGLYMNGTTDMDGPIAATQCAIPHGGSFTYNFTINQPGTYWYHSHLSGQYPDGLRGALIVNDPRSPYKDQYDEEIVLTLSDWYHDEMPPLVAKFLSVTNPTGAEPVPDAALINDTQNLKILIQPGKTYMLRIINMAAFAAQYFWIEDHIMRIIEVDGVYTDPAEAERIYLTAAQRYSVLVTTKNDTSANFAVVGSMDQDLFDTVPDTLNPNVTGWLVYDSQKSLPTPAIIHEFNEFDDFTLVPQDKMPLLDKVDYSFNLDLKMDNLGDGKNYAFLNDITYVPPKVPTLYSVLSTGTSASNPEIYGVNTHAYVLKANDVVEIVLNSNDPGKHPFHLHGHEFQAVVRSDDGTGIYNGSGSVELPAIPMRRDTFMVRPQGNIVLRFRANNPDKFLIKKSLRNADIHSLRVWLFHCHIEWHVISGLSATMIEDPFALQRDLQIPQDHLQACKDTATPTKGNAAGNTVDFTDLTGANVPVGPLPAGFTARGIVALVFSVLSAFLGIAAIAWYGMLELSTSTSAST